MKVFLLLLTAAGVATSLHAAEQATTNLLTNDDFVAAVFKTARPTQVVLESVRAMPASRILFSHSVLLRQYQTMGEDNAAGNSPPVTTNVIVKSATASTNVTSTVSTPRPPPPKYELAPMTTEQLAERRAIIGWRIQRKK